MNPDPNKIAWLHPFWNSNYKKNGLKNIYEQTKYLKNIRNHFINSKIIKINLIMLGCGLEYPMPKYYVKCRRTGNF
jgi:hypothetical protein